MVDDKDIIKTEPIIVKEGGGGEWLLILVILISMLASKILAN